MNRTTESQPFTWEKLGTAASLANIRATIQKYFYNNDITLDEATGTIRAGGRLLENHRIIKKGKRYRFEFKFTPKN